MIRLIGCVLTDEEERQSRDGPKSSFQQFSNRREREEKCGVTRSECGGERPGKGVDRTTT